MTNENFFKHDNKAYTENLNDAILIANAFDYQVPVNIPGMYNNNHYPNDNNIHKVGVADVTIVSSGSLSIGDTSITNNSNTSQVLRLRVYPNFNNFYGWKDLGWDGDDGITIDICDAGTTTSLLPSGELTNPDGNNLAGIASLRGLKEYDLLITIPVSGVLNTLSLVFVNNWNSNNRVSASINQSNVAGLESALTGLNEGLDDVETGVSNNLSKINTLSREVWNNTSQTGTSRIDSLEDSVSSLSTSITNLIQVQDVTTSQASCQPNYSIDRTATVSPCPSGYSALFIPRNSYRSVTRYVGLQGTTARFNVTNISNSANNVGAYGWLVYYPSTWNI